MTDPDEPIRRPSDVAMWHELGAGPDNVTEEGYVVHPSPARQLRADKELLRARIARLRADAIPEEARSLARLAASYVLAGDFETARRYVDRAADLAGGPGSSEPGRLHADSHADPRQQ